MSTYVMFNNALVDARATRAQQNKKTACITDACASVTIADRFFVGATISVNEDGARFRCFWTVRDTVTGAIFDGVTPADAVTLRTGESIRVAANRVVNCALEHINGLHYQHWTSRTDHCKPKKFAAMFDEREDWHSVLWALEDAYEELVDEVERFYED